MFDIRNSSIISNSQNYNNQSMLTVSRDKKGRKGLSSVNRAANDNVTMLKSIYESRPMTIFFQYPEYCCTARSTDNTVVFTQNEFKKKGYSLAFRVTGSTHVYNSVVNSMKNAGFSMTSSLNWNMLWTGIPRPDTIRNATKYQKINHFPSTMQIGRKDNLWRNVFRLKRKFGKDYEICPKTYIFPEDTKRFKIDRENEK